MKIKSIKYIKTLIPEGSGGTGYSQPNYFNVVLESGDKRRIKVDIWYIPVEMIRPEFISSLWQLGEIDNLEQAYEMYVDEIITNRLCPYNKNELMQ